VTPELRELVVEGRRQQGLPDRIEDRRTLAGVAAILLAPAAEGGTADAEVA
jgi:hypothetical protein